VFLPEVWRCLAFGPFWGGTVIGQTPGEGPQALKAFIETA